MKNRNPKDKETREQTNGSKSITMNKNKNKNKKRLGGPGLSLETFANAKSKGTNFYNPSLIKKQKEFYKNAKYVSKYKKLIKHQPRQDDISSSTSRLEGENEIEDNSVMNKKNERKNYSTPSLKEVYEKKREQKENERIEREAVIQAKKEEREKAEARRKAMREKMFKKTRGGQPVMKYRIEHLLETIQNSAKN